MTNKIKWELVLGAALCTGAGLLAGRQFLAVPASNETADDAGEAETTSFSPVTLQNLGVTVGPIEPSAYTRTVSVAAVVTPPPRSERSVYAPIGGKVLSVEVELGQFVRPTATVVTILRDPLPRPELTLTSDVLKPAQEGLHETVIALRRSSQELDIATTELQRIEGFTEQVEGVDVPVIPLQRAIDLKYEVARSEANLELASNELLKHGLSEKQVEAVRTGAALPTLDEQSWIRALARNGLWTESAKSLHGALPDSLHALPWVVATVGELAASGLASAELTAWFAEDSEAARHFLDIGVLLQRGHTLADLKRLYELGAFDPVVKVHAPPVELEGGGWDARQILVQPGSSVQTGDALVALENPEDLLLRVEPIGAEVATLLSAVYESRTFTASPMVAGAGPDLTDLRVAFVTSAEGSDGTVAYVEARNQLVAGPGGDKSRRTWGLRQGLRYLVEIPVDTFEDVYVLPASAVTEMGPDLVLFLQDGDAFTPVPIAAVYRDDRVVVIPTNMKGEGAIFPGDRFALSGGFELGLAMQAGGAVDPHAGHNH